MQHGAKHCVIFPGPGGVPKLNSQNLVTIPQDIADQLTVAKMATLTTVESLYRYTPEMRTSPLISYIERYAKLPLKWAKVNGTAVIKWLIWLVCGEPMKSIHDNIIIVD